MRYQCHKQLLAQIESDMKCIENSYPSSAGSRPWDKVGGRSSRPLDKGGPIETLLRDSNTRETSSL